MNTKMNEFGEWERPAYIARDNRDNPDYAFSRPVYATHREKGVIVGCVPETATKPLIELLPHHILSLKSREGTLPRYCLQLMREIMELRFPNTPFSFHRFRATDDQILEVMEDTGYAYIFDKDMQSYLGELTRSELEKRFVEHV